VIACLALTPAIDRLVEVDRLAPGAIHRPEAAVAVAGGKGLNLARAAAALGAEVEAVAPLGGDMGRWVAARLHDERVAARIVWTEAETRICTSIADREEDSLTELYEAGEPLAPVAWEALAKRAVEGAPGWLAISGSLPAGVDAERIAALIDRARRAGARVALDTHGPALRAGLGAGPELVKVNAAEAADVAGPRADPEELRRLAGGEGHGVVVTHGVEGLVAVGADGERHSASVDARGPYPVGSGDACLAGLLTALDAGGSWEGALRMAVGAAAANAELPGAGRLDRARAQDLARRSTVAAEG
jgi:1-phosphofructokinase family hexose kinase